MCKSKSYKYKMSVQKHRSRSQLAKQGTLLPLINRKNMGEKDKYYEETGLTADLYDEYLSKKLDRALDDKPRVISPKQPKLSMQLLSENSVKGYDHKDKHETTRLHHIRSTPKLQSKSVSPEKLKTVRNSKLRYLANQKLSIQLKLPSKLKDVSIDSDEDKIQNAMTKEEKTQKVQPIIYLLKKNRQFNMVREKKDDSQLFMTQNQNSVSGSRMQIRQNNQSFPMMPNLPNRQTLYPLPKTQKYIKEKFVGQEAITKFYNRYKNIERVRDMQNFKLEFNPLTTILTILQSYNIPPKKMEIIKLQGEQAILDLKNCALGSGISIKAIAEIIQKVSIFEEVDLSYNQIAFDLTDAIIPQLSKMKRINLAYNKISRRGIELLTQMFYDEEKDQTCILQGLNLEGNNISDGSFGNFFIHLGYMNYLTVLNLSKNCLGNSVAQKLKQFFLDDSTLSELYLHWCQLGTKATKTIFQGLYKNFGLKVLDLSWNQIGMQGTLSFCKFLKQNQTVAHLDVSYCQIDEKDTTKIAKYLKYNHSIYGLHYQGNKGYIDIKGYLHPLTKEQQEIPMSIRAGLIQRIHSINIIHNYYGHQPTSINANVCWICEGWEQKYFKIKKQPGQKGCFIHLDFQFYTGVLMQDMGTYYQILRMCPPKSITIFYTKVTDKDKLVHKYNPSTVGEIKVIDKQLKTPQFIINDKLFSDVVLDKVNRISPPKYLNQIFNQDYITKVHCQPRSTDMRSEHLFVQKPPPKVKKPKKLIKKPPLIKEIQVRTIPEDFDNIFDKHKNMGDGQTYQDFIRKCVEFDITHSKVIKIVKKQNQLNDIRSILEKNYDTFQKIYYYLCNNNPNSNGVYSISETRFQKFVDEQSYQTKRITKAKIRLKLISCLSNASSDSQIQGFYRPQFFQFLLRLAMDKWCCVLPKKEGETEVERKQREKYPISIPDAFAKMIKTLRKYEQKADSTKWCEQNLTSYDMSIVVKSYSAIFERIYEKYAGLTQKNLNTKQKKKILLQEYKMMFLQASIRKTKEALKDLEVAYRTAKKVEIEDGISDTGLDYVQFLQSFVRFAEGLYLIPVGSESHHLWEKQLVKSSQIPLFLKVQKLLKQIYSKNYDLHSRKFDALLENGLFPEQVVTLMAHYKALCEDRQSFVKSLATTHAKMNSFGVSAQKITLKFLIEMVQVKARQIQLKNRQKMMAMQAEQQRLQKEVKKDQDWIDDD